MKYRFIFIAIAVILTARGVQAKELGGFKLNINDQFSFSKLEFFKFKTSADGVRFGNTALKWSQCDYELRPSSQGAVALAGPWTVVQDDSPKRAVGQNVHHTLDEKVVLEQGGHRLAIGCRGMSQDLRKAMGLIKMRDAKGGHLGRYPAIEGDRFRFLKGPNHFVEGDRRLSSSKKDKYFFGWNTINQRTCGWHMEKADSPHDLMKDIWTVVIDQEPDRPAGIHYMHYDYSKKVVLKNGEARLAIACDQGSETEQMEMLGPSPVLEDEPATGSIEH